MQVTGKLKSVEKDIYKKQFSPKLRFYLLFSKKICMTIKPLKIAAQIIFLDRQINLNTRNSKIIAYNQEICKTKHGALFLRFSILIATAIRYYHNLYMVILDFRK